MALDLSPQEPPLVIDHSGVVRVENNRLTLDTIVAGFESGWSPEQIVDQFPPVTLSQVYSAIAFYLRNKPQVDKYLAEGAEDSERVRSLMEKRHGSWEEIRARLLARSPRKQ